MTGQPRVGIVLRTRDRPAMLDRAIRDVLAQDHHDWQLILVNDEGDPAHVDAVVAAHAEALAGRAVVLHLAAGTGGRCVAANVGMRAAVAPFAILHDDDDLWDPSFLRRTTAWLAVHPEDAAVVVPIEIVYEREERGRLVEMARTPFWPGLHHISYADLLIVNRMVPIGILYRRSLHDEVGYYDETLETVEDWEFYLRVAERHEIGFIEGPPLAFWSQRPWATGAAANSMFALAGAHGRDSARVRDRALRQFVRDHGAGLPLMLGGIVREALLRDEEQRRRRSLRGMLARVRGRLRGR